MKQRNETPKQLFLIFFLRTTKLTKSIADNALASAETQRQATGEACCWFHMSYQSRI